MLCISSLRRCDATRRAGWRGLLQPWTKILFTSRSGRGSMDGWMDGLTGWLPIDDLIRGTRLHCRGFMVPTDCPYHIYTYFAWGYIRIIIHSSVSLPWRFFHWNAICRYGLKIVLCITVWHFIQPLITHAQRYQCTVKYVSYSSNQGAIRRLQATG